MVADTEQHPPPEEGRPLTEGYRLGALIGTTAQGRLCAAHSSDGGEFAVLILAEDAEPPVLSALAEGTFEDGSPYVIFEPTPAWTWLGETAQGEVVTQPLPASDDGGEVAAQTPVVAGPNPTWTSPPPQLELKVLDGRFRLLRRLGSGGMGEVHVAEQISLGREVVVKLLHPALYAGSPKAVARFEQEAKMAARLNHPNIASLYASGQTADGRLYLAMEHVEGEPLDVLLRREGRLDVPRALEIADQLCDALIEIHRQGIVHRDLKPENILLAQMPGGERVKVIDFGIARNLTDEGPGMTASGMVFGTPRYISPEQARGEPATPRADQYPLGLMLYEMVSGALPFDESKPISYLRRHALEDAPPPSARVPSLSLEPALEAIIMRCLEKHPEARFDTISTLQSALRSLSDPTPPPRAASQPVASPRPEARKELSLRLLTVLVGALMLGLAVWIVSEAFQSSAPSPVDAGPTVCDPIPRLEGHDMRCVPEGGFLQGSERGPDNELPQRRVHLASYWIDTTEVTVSQFTACVEAGACSAPSRSGLCGGDFADANNWGKGTRRHHPVNCVTWAQALEYCTWRGGYLPTEAQWEKAARGTDGRTYPWGQAPPTCDLAVMKSPEGVDGCGEDHSARVGGRDNGSVYGVLDMVGNVWEWTRDVYSARAYREGPAEDPRGPDKGPLRVYRGGGMENTAPNLRVSIRRGNTPASAMVTIGFRCAATHP